MCTDLCSTHLNRKLFIVESLMLINLRAKNKIRFIQGTCRRDDYSGELEEQWKKCNAFVLAWIMNTVSKELLSSIAYATDAAAVWSNLKERFDKIDGSRGYQLHRDICTLTQGNSSVSSYFSKLRLLWDEFDALVPPPACDCAKSRTYVNHLAYLRLFAFLMGLNDTYTHARSQILMMSPLPSVSKAYALVMGDESQKMTANSQIGTHAVEQIALYADRNNVSKGFQSKRFCDYCKIPGHTREECYKLNGYPPDWKFKKKSGGLQTTRSQEHVNHVNTDVHSQAHTDVFALVDHVVTGKNNDSNLNVPTQLMFTHSQYNQILSMLKRDDADASSGKAVDYSANMAGPLKWKSGGDW